MKKTIYILLMITAALSSCSNDDYINVIPAKSIALLSVDMQQISQEQQKQNQGITQLVQSLFGDNYNNGQIGIDLTSKLYFFESAEGTLGLVARLSDQKQLKKTLEELSDKGHCQQPSKRQGVSYAFLKGSWMVGFNDQALMIMGPVVPAQQTETMQQMGRYFKQEDDRSIKTSPLFERLETIDAPISMIAKISAFPIIVADPLSFGAPKDADHSQIILCAGMTIEDKCLFIDGETFSFNQRIDKALSDSKKIFHNIGKHYTACLTDKPLIQMLTNAKGQELLPVLIQNKSFQTLLTGANAVVDMNKIINSIDGDIMIAADNVAAKEKQFAMEADLADTRFWNDVDYWKKSRPAGSSFELYTKPGDNYSSYRYTDGHLNFFFSIEKPTKDNTSSNQNKFTCSTDEELFCRLLDRQTSVSKEATLPSQIVNKAEASKMSIICNLKRLDNDTAQMLNSFVTPLLGQINFIIYSMK